ncbi:hypothetical protein, partial [Endozoicomonas sp. ONNA2]|uniref:hypothetical protein n=1 Tax=Endozoicomonas sp. ONNA2 TaxID=2828741 RepID=UPI0035A1467B
SGPDGIRSLPPHQVFGLYGPWVPSTISEGDIDLYLETDLQAADALLDAKLMALSAIKGV